MNDTKEKVKAQGVPESVEAALRLVVSTIIDSKIFDRDFYLAQVPEAERPQVKDPIAHYVVSGDSRNLSPHPLFDPAVYRRYNMKALEMRQNSLAHYLSGQWRGPGITSLMFDSQWYIDANPKVRSSGLSPLAHYLETGIHLGLAPVESINPALFLSRSEGSSWRDDASYRFILAHHKGALIPEQRPGLVGGGGDISRSKFPDEKVRAHLKRLLEFANAPLTRDELDAAIKRINQLRLECAGLQNPKEGLPTVSVIIPVCNQLRFTLNCIESIVQIGALVTFEVLVINDCSTDETATTLEQLDGIRVVNKPSNSGFVSSCNEGATAARGEFLVFLNNDTHVLPGWMDELLSTLKQDPSRAIAGAQALDPSGALQEAGAIVFRDGSAANYGRGGDPSRPEYSYLRNVDYCSGACIMIAKELFARFGGFDTRYAPAYGEDVDLAFTARDQGYAVVYQPFSKIVHFEGISSGRDVSKGVKAYQVINLEKLRDKWKQALSDHERVGTSLSRQRNRGACGHILFVDACFPAPDRDAGSMVADSWIKILISLGYHVTFIAAHQFIRIPKLTERLERMGVYCPVVPYELSIKDFLASHGHDFDAIVANRYQSAAPIYEILQTAGISIPSIFLPIDLHYLREARLAELEQSSEMKLNSVLTQARELEVIRQSTLVCVHSSYEKQELSKYIPQPKIEVSPIMVPVPGRSKAFEDRKDICFVGGFRHLPNADGVVFFVREVWPLVRKSLPDAVFKIIGAEAPEEVVSLASDSVEVVGHVEDLSPIFDSIKLSVAPIRYGAGVKGKVVLSMGVGAPVVGTPLAFEGMDLDLGREALSGATPEELAMQITRLYTDAALWTNVSNAAGARAKREYSEEANLPLIRGYLKSLGLSPREDTVGRLLSGVVK